METRLIRVRARNLHGQPVERERRVAVVDDADAEAIRARWIAELREDTQAVTSVQLGRILGTNLSGLRYHAAELGGLRGTGTNPSPLKPREQRQPWLMFPLRRVWEWLRDHYVPAGDGRTFGEFFPGTGCVLLYGLLPVGETAEFLGLRQYQLHAAVWAKALGEVHLPWTSERRRYLLPELANREEELKRFRFAQ